MGWEAATAAEELAWSLDPYLDASGVIEEPSSSTILRFRDALYATLLLFTGTPTVEQLQALPLRAQTAFFSWLFQALLGDD